MGIDAPADGASVQAPLQCKLSVEYMRASRHVCGWSYKQPFFNSWPVVYVHFT